MRSPFAFLRRPSSAVRAALATVALLLAGPAAAQQASPGMPAPGTAAFDKEFARADVNKDGKLTEEEAVQGGFFTDGQFKETDRDLDGQVTLFELGDAMQKKLRGYFDDSDRADADKDGYVTEEEARVSGTSILDIFRRADRDGDGRVARDEIDVFTRDTYFSETQTRGVVPNIINKRF